MSLAAAAYGRDAADALEVAIFLLSALQHLEEAGNFFKPWHFARLWNMNRKAQSLLHVCVREAKPKVSCSFKFFQEASW